MAAAKGWTTTEVLAMMQDQRKFAALAGDVKDAFPSDFSSAVFAGTPAGTSDLYFKGSVPAGVSSLISESGLTVATHPNIGKNFTEWNAQFEAVVSHLDGQAYDDYVVAFDDVGTIEVLIGSGATLPVLPASIADDVTITGTAGALLREEWVRGGSTMYNGGTFWCTSSWNVVQQGTGVFGTVTADHCSPLDEVDDNSGNPVSATLQGGHFGDHGDMAWYTTVDNEPPKFWADDVDVRPVLGVKQTFFRNDVVCVYGRASNSRQCDSVYRKSVATADGLRHMVVMDEDHTSGGDSGGGWSFGTEAAGVHRGDIFFDSEWRNIYSKANRIDNALGVDVRIDSP